MTSRDVLLRRGGTGKTPSFAEELLLRMGGGVAGWRNPTAHYIGKDRSGVPMYRVSYSDAMNVRRVTTVTYDANTKKVGKPNLKGPTGGIPDPSDMKNVGLGGTGAAAALQRAKDAAAAWVVSQHGEYLGPQAQQGLLKTIREWKGDAASLNSYMKFIQANVPVSTPGVASFEFDELPPVPGGGRGGSAGPVYEAPDRRVVEDYVRGVSVALLGGIPDEGYIQQFTDLYMKDHRRNFDTPDREIDPAQSVVEAFRQTKEYQEIHRLRPDSEDERSWVAARRAAAQQGGLQQDLQEDFAIQQATIGGDLEDTRRAASFRQLQTTGRAPTLLEGQFREVAKTIFQQVRV